MITILFRQDITFVIFSLFSDNQYSIHNATPLVIPADRYTFRVTLIISSPAFLSDTHLKEGCLRTYTQMSLY